MSNIIIASEAKRKVIGVLRRPDHLSMLYSTWPVLAWELEVDEVNIKTLRDRIIVGTCFLRDAISAVIEDWVSKKGFEATLDVLVSALEKCGLKYIGERLEDEFQIHNEQNKTAKVEPLFMDTLPKEIGYYVNRTLVSRCNLDINKLIQSALNSSDVLCFTGIQRFELGKYKKVKSTDHSSSQIQLHQLSTQFITLDSANHFNKICSKTKQPVHLIEFSRVDNQENFKWVRSSGNVERIQFSVRTETQHQDKLDEADIIKIAEKHCLPVCFSDCPGMGKSILLVKVGHLLRKTFPGRIVVHFELSYFVQKMKDLKSSSTKSTLEAVLYHKLCKNESEGGQQKLSEVFSSDSIEVELLLDGFDEIFPSDIKFCLDLIKEINKFKFARIWIASRPHFLENIENALNILGYNIQPLNEFDQTDFLCSYWASLNPRLSQSKLHDLAKTSIGIIISQTKDQDFAGIPLRCFLIGQIFEEIAMDFCTVECEHQELPALMGINSTSDLFKKMVEVKLRKYGSTYGITKFRKGVLVQMLMKLAMDLVFPEGLKIFNIDLHNLKVSLPDLVNTGLLVNYGENLQKEMQFVHRTIAEFFCAWCISSIIKQSEMDDKWWSADREEFFIKEVLGLRRRQKRFGYVFPYQLLDEDKTLNNEQPVDLFFKVQLAIERKEYYLDKWKRELLNKKVLPRSEVQIKQTVLEEIQRYSSLFANPVVCYFLNSFQLTQNEHGNPSRFLIKSYQLKNVIMGCVRSNFFDIFNFFVSSKSLTNYWGSIFDNYFLYILLHHGSLNFVKTGFAKFVEYNKLNSRLKLYILNHVGIIGDYSVFEYFCNEQGFIRHLSDGKPKELFYLIAKQTKFCNADVISQKIHIIRFVQSVNNSFVNFKHWGSPSPLFCENIHVDIACCLIEEGADVSLNSRGNTTIHYECWAYYKILFSADEYLKILNAIPNKKLEELVHERNAEGKTPLHSFLDYCSLTYSLFLKFKSVGTDFNTCERFGYNMLGTAIIKKRSSETLKYLLKAGTNPNHVVKNGYSVLILWSTFQERDVTVLDDLIKAGCDIFKQENGYTFLYVLLRSEYKISPEEFHTLVEILIANGKEKLLETNSEREPELAPLQLAFSKVQIHKETISLLKTVLDINHLIVDQAGNK